MDKDTARQFALAIANANGHPNADEWADKVAANFAGEPIALPPLMTSEQVSTAAADGANAESAA